jgi:4'-phosphopantetheinyl transferase
MVSTLVEVHWIDLDARAPDIGHWRDMLDGEERARAQRFAFDRDRRRFIVRHGWLRELLARRLSVSPAAIRFMHNPFGKPLLRGESVRFNLSHSEGKALCVAADGLELGCDVERRNRALASRELAESVFTPVEQQQLSSLQGGPWVEGFFNGWTRKEAYIKARGLGLSCPLDSFDVSLAPDEPALLLRGCEGWSVQSLEPALGFTAAVVAQGANWALSFPRGADTGEPRSARLDDVGRPSF